MENTLKINYRTSSGSGRFEISLAILPCTVKDFNIILGMVNRSNDPAAHVELINVYIKNQVENLKKDRGLCNPERDQKAIAKINGTIKKYIALNDLLVKEYGAEKISDTDAGVKIKAADIYTLKHNNGEKYAEKITGFMFEKGGYIFDGYKAGSGRYTRYIILLHGTGQQVAEASGKNEMPAAITPRILEALKNVDIKKAREYFRPFMDAAGYTYDENTNENTSESKSENTNESASEKTSENTNDNKEGETMKANTSKNYFSGVKNLEDLRKVYRDLLKANHPDNGGSTEATQAINAAYKEAFDLLKSGAKLDDEKEKLKWNEAEDEAIREALYKVIHLDGLNIEIIGCWIWIDGNTYNAREALKDAGFAWSKARHKWHFAPYEKKYYKGSKKPFEQLREMYGSQEIESEKTEKITE